MTDPAADSGESDLRRRAAWLLGLLVLVAVLVVVLILTLAHTSGSSPGGKGSDDSLVATPSSSATSATSHRTNPTRRPSSSTIAHPTTVNCIRLCVVDGDLGNSIAAINDYRAEHGQKRVPGTVSKSAQACALSNGGTCHGAWAESQVPKPTGAAALQKIMPLGKLLDPQLKSFEIGWAYDPGASLYYFAIVKHA